MTDGQTNVPRRTEALLQSLAGESEFRDDVLGDLAEEYAVRARWDGAGAARRWYYREALRLVPYLLRDARRNFAFSDARRLVGVVAWSTLAVSAVDSTVVGGLYRLVFRLTGIPLNAYMHHWETTEGIPATQILWLGATLLCGLVGGVTTVSFTSRPRLSDTVITAGLWASLMVASGWAVVPKTFLALNTSALLVATLSGAIAKSLLRARGDYSGIE